MNVSRSAASPVGRTSCHTCCRIDAIVHLGKESIVGGGDARDPIRGEGAEG